MDLKTYLKTNKMSAIGFAERFNVPYTTIWRILNEKGTPTARIAKKIELATNGAIPAIVTLKLGQ